MNEAIPISSAISYFRDCYRLDTRTTQLSNFFGRKVEQRLLFEGKERLLTGELPYLPIPNDVGEKLDKTLQLYSKEKTLYYCSFFVVGFEKGMNGKKQRVCAPLFLHEAQLFKQDEGYAIKVSLEQRIVNTDSISNLRVSEDDPKSLIDSVIENHTLGFEIIKPFREILAKNYSSLEADEILLYPSLTKESNIKRLFKNKEVIEGKYKVVSAGGIALVKRSNNTQGIMTELEEMMELSYPDFPDSIRAVFKHENKTNPLDVKQGFVPALLNNSQQQILRNAHQEHLSVAIGPPGTGKSFTIASLAIEFLSRGKSVLIVSKTDQAVDVVNDKIQSELNISNATVRAGKQDYLKELKNRLDELLKGFRINVGRKFVFNSGKQIDDLKSRIEGCYELARESIKQYDNLLDHETRWSDVLSNSKPESLFHKTKLTFIKWLTSLKEPHWLIVNDYMHTLTSRVQLVREYIDLNFERRINQGLVSDRSTFRKFLNAIRARTSSRREKLFSELNFKLLFNAFPVWLCKLSDLQKVLPLKSELFDLVIIDEATQCDIASCLPAIYRGKSVVIVGDPKQLHHISFLSSSVQHSLQEKYGLTNFAENLDYRNLSILDFADNALKSQEQLTLLNEHYRSVPDLIKFSNQHFYAGSLKMMNVIPEDHSINSIEHIQVKSLRDSTGVNIGEAERVIKDLEKVINREKHLDSQMKRSLGILSPFRNQADLLGKMIVNRFTIEEINDHEILSGTAHSFQGEERDIMFLSFCLDKSSHSTAFRHINRADVFNVSITRAKSNVKVYTSFNQSTLSKESYLRAYLEQVNEPSTEASSNRYDHDEFLEAVRGHLVDLNYELKVGYEVADLSLDLLITNNDKLIAIDLIGYPGYFKDGIALRSYKVLHRTGIVTFPLPYSFWKFERERCVTALEEFIGQYSR